ncbi:acetylserotonin methytransferase-like protein [Colletotrichum tofieldiae]|nr:acetylserotonin methytransferase-like protein [Colletotrichum tofieldiae]
MPAPPPATAAPIQRPPPVADIPPRSDTAFSQTHTLVRNNSTRSRSSIAKLPFPEEPSSSSQEQPTLRSIFPRYNPEVPLNQQDYFPTQTSPTHIPRAVINRTTWYPDPEGDGQNNQHRSPVRSPLSGGSTQRWPRRNVEPPIIPNVSTNEHMKSLWKVSNGWKAPPSEGRVYCMKLSQEKDAPIYTLSSSSQPFYNLRLDPTSASAYVTLSRHDPAKIYKAPNPTASSSASSILSGVVGHKDHGKGAESKHWQEVLTTTLEEESRKHPPNDGLVALLYPLAAAKMALDKPDDMNAVMTAETECARLVWDEDSGSHFLVHPALATPFCVTIERSPAWSRVEYTLEHHESPQHLAKLARDGTGGGYLEVDTAIAAKIDSFFLIDVAVTALLLVAAADEKNTKVETFEPPPMPREPVGGERRLSKREEKKRAAAAARRGKMEEFEIDIESQDSSFAKLEQAGKEARDGLPWPLRALFKVVAGLFKCLVWFLTLGFKALAAIVKGLARCVGVKSE